MKRLILTMFVLTPLLVSGQAFQQTLAGVIQYNSGKVIQLAEAVPEDKYDWRPAEGVRSFGEVVLHLAGANYFFGSMAADTQGMKDLSGVSGKANIIAALKESYDFVGKSVTSIPDDKLGDELKFPDGTPMTRQAIMMIAFGHCEEHMGQMIAYARSNGIVPPWSQGN